jgi:hypothetical protein
LTVFLMIQLDVVLFFEVVSILRFVYECWR